MRALIQRVSEARVSVDGIVHGEIQRGLLVLLGITHSDQPDDAEKLAQKIIKLRIFNDNAGKMNLSVQDIQGQMLIISQFTLYADAKKGNRPSYIEAAKPEQASSLYEHFQAYLINLGLEIERGVFGAHMQVKLINDGPVTLWLDTVTM